VEKDPSGTKTMKQTTDLFGKVKKAQPHRTRLEKALRKFDEATFEERLNRLKWVDKIYPKGILLSGEMEFVFTFSEVKDSYIAGYYIAAIVLAQAFIEKIFHQHFVSQGLSSTANRGLGRMINYAKENDSINSLILDKVDALRLKRNPFTHVKDWDYPHSISKRMVKDQTITPPHELLENDAKEAIQVMFLLATHKL
jgi:hypothetical protein